MDCVGARHYRNRHVTRITLKGVRSIFIAIGEITEKTYAEGKTKAELLRKLNKKYPYHRRRNGSGKPTGKSVFPEALIIIRRMR